MSFELRRHGVEIVARKYICLRYDRVRGLAVTYADEWVPWYSGAIDCTRKRSAIEPHSHRPSATRPPKRSGPDTRHAPDPASVSRPKVVACGSM